VLAVEFVVVYAALIGWVSVVVIGAVALMMLRDVDASLPQEAMQKEECAA